jgi:hypothetical protein
MIRFSSEKQYIVFISISGGIHTLSSTGRNDNNIIPEEKLTNSQVPMACSLHGTVSEEYDSDFDNSSHEDDEQLTHKDSINESYEEQQNQIIVKIFFEN